MYVNVNFAAIADLQRHGHQSVGLGLHLGHSRDGLHGGEELSLGGELLALL